MVEERKFSLFDTRVLQVRVDESKDNNNKPQFFREVINQYCYINEQKLITKMG